MSAAAALRPPRARSPMFAAAVLAIVVAGLAAATGMLAARARSGQAAQAARPAAVAAAKREVPALLSYSYQTFRADLSRAGAGTTGRFRSTYRALMSSQVGPAARHAHVVTQASVAGASVISASPVTATLLLFLSEQTRTDARAEAVLNDTAVRVRMRKVNGTWLVAGLVPRS